MRIAKRKAEELGKPLGDILSDAVVLAYRPRPSSPTRLAHDLPVSGKGGLLEGVDLDDSSGLADLMDRG